MNAVQKHAFCLGICNLLDGNALASEDCLLQRSCPVKSFLVPHLHLVHCCDALWNASMGLTATLNAKSAASD